MLITGDHHVFLYSYVNSHLYLRYLTFSHIRITLSSSGIMIQPHIQSTRFLPLYISLPPFPGTPINLLPFSTPAFYLNTYTGPTSGLVKQFELNLVGLGVGNCFSSPDSTDAYAQFVIAWIDIQNEIYSNSCDPVDILNTILRFSLTCVAVKKFNSLHIFEQASLILSTLASLNPLICINFFFMHMLTPLIVQIPADLSFFKSIALLIME